MTLRIVIDWEREFQRTPLYDLLIINYAVNFSIEKQIVQNLVSKQVL